MSLPIMPQPPNPLVAQNRFRQRSYTAAPIPPFANIRERLPKPIMPSHVEWVEMYWRAWEMAWQHLHRPVAESGLIANYIDSARGDDLFMWDSAFMTQFGIYGRRLFDFMGTLDNFYARQHDNGFICRQIDSREGLDRYYPFDPNGTGPNIFAWAEWRYFRLSGDDGRLAQVFWPLLAYHCYGRAHRTWPDGLYWATGASSGMTNQPRVPDSMYHHRHWSWVDATMQAVVSAHLLEKLAAQLDEAEHVSELAAERAALVQAVNERMWNAETSYYHDIAPDGRFSPVRSIGAYWGLLDEELVPPERRGPFVQHLRDNWSFNLPHRIPSQSADSEGYNAESGHGWRGGVWSPTNFMVLKGLRAHDFPRLAHEIAVNHLRNVCDTYLHTDTFWENYAPETAAPGADAASNFVGWTGLTPIAILLEDVIGISVDWPLRRVMWDRRLETDAVYGVRNYPLGREGEMSLLGDREQVSVITDVPFTLTIQDETQTVKTAVAAGATDIDLT